MLEDLKLKKRQYKVKSNKDFLVFGLVFFFLCIWAIKDAWYPSEKVLKKHPREIVSSFQTSGKLEKLHVNKGSFVKEGSVIAELSSEDLNEQLNNMKATYLKDKKSADILRVAIKNAIENGATKASISEMQNRKSLLESKMKDLEASVKELNEGQDKTRIIAEKNGEVVEIYVGERIQVSAGENILKIIPQDNFYLFNKSLAIFSFFACIFFFVFHFFGN